MKHLHLQAIILLSGIATGLLLSVFAAQQLATILIIVVAALLVLIALRWPVLARFQRRRAKRLPALSVRRPVARRAPARRKAATATAK